MMKENVIVRIDTVKQTVYIKAPGVEICYHEKDDSFKRGNWKIFLKANTNLKCDIKIKKNAVYI